MKKVKKSFYSYPDVLDKIKDLAELLGKGETVIIESALTFFVNAPRRIQERILGYYYRELARLHDSNPETFENDIQKLLDSDPEKVEKGNTE